MSLSSHVRTDGGPVPILFETVSVVEAVGRPAGISVDLSEFDHVLKTAAALDDEIDERLSKVTYMEKVAREWNPDVTPKEIADLGEKLLQKATILEEAADELAHHRVRRPRLPFSESDLPRLPDSWVLRQLTPVKGFPMSGKIIDQAGKAPTYKQSISNS